MFSILTNAHNRHTLGRSAAVAALAVSSIAALSGGVASAATPAAPINQGCPPAFQVLTLEFLASQGPYQQPFTLDAAGNNDGLICGKALNDSAFEAVCGATCPVPVLYTFIDNTLTPA